MNVPRHIPVPAALLLVLAAVVGGRGQPLPGGRCRFAVDFVAWAAS